MMDPETLRDQLANLHEELRDAQQIDPRSKALLSEVLKDIQRIVDTPGREAAPVPGSADLSPGERLEKIAIQFEANHPGIASSSRRLIDLLGKVGL